MYNKSIPQNEQLAEELHKPIIRKFKRREVYSAFKDNIWAADLADMQLISKFNKGFRFLLCVIDIYSKCAWVVLKKFLLLKKLKIQFHGNISLMILMVKKLLEHFMKKNCKR